MVSIAAPRAHNDEEEADAHLQRREQDVPQLGDPHVEAQQLGRRHVHTQHLASVKQLGTNNPVLLYRVMRKGYANPKRA